MLELPFEDDSFDAVWCANVTQYLTDDEFTQAIAEFRRVTRSGGIVALKDVLSALFTVEPAPAGVIHCLCRRGSTTGRRTGAGSNPHLEPNTVPRKNRS